jgi:hypothetical protein
VSDPGGMDRKVATFEDYLKTYSALAELIRKETCTKYPYETDMLFEFVDNWPDLIKVSKEKCLEAINSLSGIILISSWRLTNWITFDILSGKYFEAIRNLRFVFEGSVYAVIVENAIEATVFEKWEKLSSLDLKAEIFEIWEECKRRRVYRNGKISADRVKALVTEYVARKVHPSKKGEMQHYIEIYTQILCDEKLYLRTSQMIEECVGFLRLDDPDIADLKTLWHELSKYQHFSYAYLEAVVDDPELCLIEKLNDGLLKRSLNFYFETLDFFYAVLAWRFEYLRKEIRAMCEWWRTNFNRTFAMTEKTLRNLAE